MKVSEEIEVIKHAAVMSESGWIFIGKCHADCFRKLEGVGLRHFHKAEGQGFVTSKGRFVFRDKAATIALKAKQIDKDAKLLFSEDLWSPVENGKYNYCEIKGYVLKTTN